MMGKTDVFACGAAFIFIAICGLVRGNECTDNRLGNLTVVKMCESGTHTFPAAYLSASMADMGDGTKCSCSLTALSGGSNGTSMALNQDPRVSNCSASLAVRGSSQGDYTCLSTVHNSFVTNNASQVTIEVLRNGSVDFGFCLVLDNVGSNRGNTFSLTCQNDASVTGAATLTSSATDLPFTTSFLSTTEPASSSQSSNSSRSSSASSTSPSDLSTLSSDTSTFSSASTIAYESLSPSSQSSTLSTTTYSIPSSASLNSSSDFSTLSPESSTPLSDPSTPIFNSSTNSSTSSYPPEHWSNTSSISSTASSDLSSQPPDILTTSGSSRSSMPPSESSTLSHGSSSLLPTSSILSTDSSARLSTPSTSSPPSSTVSPPSSNSSSGSFTSSSTSSSHMSSPSIPLSGTAASPSIPANIPSGSTTPHDAFSEGSNQPTPDVSTVASSSETTSVMEDGRRVTPLRPNPENFEESSDTFSVVPLAVGICGAFLFLFIIALIVTVVCRRRKRKPKSELTEPLRKHFIMVSYPGFSRVQLEDNVLYESSSAMTAGEAPKTGGAKQEAGAGTGVTSGQARGHLGRGQYLGPAGDVYSLVQKAGEDGGSGHLQSAQLRSTPSLASTEVQAQEEKETAPSADHRSDEDDAVSPSSDKNDEDLHFVQGEGADREQKEEVGGYYGVSEPCAAYHTIDFGP